jgi:outer membrane protein, multidrug efflux system
MKVRQGTPQRRAVGLGLLLFTLALVGINCAGWRAPRQPDPKLPQDYSLRSQTAEQNDNAWWQELSAPALDRIMAEALSENLSLAQAIGRLDQMLAGHKMSRSSLFPSISGQLSLTETGDFEDEAQGAAIPTGFEMPTTPRFNASLTALYEVDIWGKLDANRAAAKADLLAGTETLRALTMTLAAQVGRTYFRIVELQQQDALLRQTITSYDESLGLVKARYERGISISLDVYQAETTLAAARANHALITGQLATSRNALAALLGHFPGTPLVAADATWPTTAPIVPVGVPSDLLIRRPDVRGAYWDLQAADRRVAEAVANRLPGITLTGAISGRDDDLATALKPDNLIWNAVGGIVAPIFDAGRRSANVDMADAAWQIQTAAFQEALVNAVREVEDALILGRQQEAYLNQLADQVDAASSSLRLARDRYLQGVATYLQVTISQTAYYNSRSKQIGARRGQIDAYIALVTALGGGWTDEILQNAHNRDLFTTEDKIDLKGKSDGQ